MFLNYMDAKFIFTRFMEPLVFGDYPKSMKDYAKERLPRFTSEEKKLMKGSFDFVGVNYYTSRFGKSSNFTGQKPRYTTDPLASEECTFSLFNFFLRLFFSGINAFDSELYEDIIY